jgi:hypothetical protein
LLNTICHTENFAPYITAHATSTKIDLCHGLCPTIFT